MTTPPVREGGPRRLTCRHTPPTRTVRDLGGAVSRLGRQGPRDDFTATLLGRLSSENFFRTLDEMTRPPTRHSTSREFREVLASAAMQLSTFEYTVTCPEIDVPGGTSANCVAERPGTAAGRRDLVVVTAHLDSINRDGATLPAPGADDNASGSAGLMELARVLATEDWRHDVRLILFGGEEQGLLGSIDHVAGLSAFDRSRISAVINMDMIARRNGPTPGVMIEGGEPSVDLIDRLADSAATWTGLQATTSLNPFASDHVPFIEAGLPAVLTIEADDSANTDVHTDRDVIATIDVGLAMEILCMNLAVVVGYLRR